MSSLAGRAFALGLIVVGCDGNPPMDDAGRDAGRFVFDGGMPDAGTPCASDEECDDGVSCTMDSCDTLSMRCRNGVDPASCDDGVFCNGVEQCHPARGCIAGGRQTCNDEDVCTIDRCDEEAKICRHFDRDLDEDGDADWFCTGGGDCDDTNPSVSSIVSEICLDGLDNDCDEMSDEAECVAPRYDTCADPLDVSAGGLFTLSTNGATPTYVTGCAGSARDLVATFTLTEARSLVLEAESAGTTFFFVNAALRTTCDDRLSELACESGAPAELRRRSLAPGTYFVIVSASATGDISLRVDFGDPIAPPTNDTCAAPLDVSAGGTFAGSFVEVADDLTTTCGFSGSPDLVYTFTTTAEHDVHISAQTISGYSLAISVRTDCDEMPTATQLRCVYGAPAATIAHQLPPGTYYIVVEGPSSPDVDFTLDVQFRDPTPPAAGDVCATALALPLNTMVSGTFSDKEDDIDVSCGFRYRDVVHSFTLGTTSDVTITFDAGVWGNIALRRTCEDGSAVSQIRCTSGDPVVTRVRGLAAGAYFVIVEASRSSDYSLRVDAMPATPVTDVSGNDNCSSAYDIPAAGGLFRGNTTSLLPDLETNAGCGGNANSNDAAFRLVLSARRHVVLTTDDSSFDTVLHVHRDMCRDMGELYCDDDSGTGNASLLDRIFEPGTYYVIVDGWGSGSTGEYMLGATITAP